jgi:type II secretory pathway pseudopilin PulG
MWVRLPRLRFTVKRLMIVVAIVGFILAGGLWSVEMWKERRRRLEQAARYAVLAKAHGAAVARYLSALSAQPEPEQRRFAEAHLVVSRRLLDNLLRHKARYEHAARYPWLPVTPDPPPPD